MNERVPQPKGNERSEGREKTVEELREELLATGKVQEFIDVDEVTLIEPQGEFSQIAKTSLEIIDECLHRPMVIDVENAFGGHRERRKWRADLPLDQRDVYENNALRRNYIAVSLSAVDYLFYEMSEETKQEFLPEFTELMTTLQEGFVANDENPDGTLTIAEKRAFVEERLNPFLYRVRNAVVG